MRLTVIVDDQQVCIDGVCFDGIDLSQLSQNNIHAIQWYETYGEVEYTSRVENLKIDSLDDFLWVIDAWEAQKQLLSNPPPQTEEELLEGVKYEAEMWLANSDWTMLPDVPLANKQEWAEYREALRAIRSNITINPEWPVKPPVIWVSNE